MDQEWIKNKVFALYDGQLSAAEGREIQAHLDACAECRDLLEDWKKTAQTFLQPLQVERSATFVQSVMQRIEAFGQKEEGIRWSAFARWAFPTLALSVASFTLTLAYTLQPTAISTETLLLGDHEASVTPEWLDAVEINP